MAWMMDGCLISLAFVCQLNGAVGFMLVMEALLFVKSEEKNGDAL